MSPMVLHLLHQSLFGAVAAAGFGVLFNFGMRSLPWCAAAGALALWVRTICLDMGWSLEGASFLAAVMVRVAVNLSRPRQSHASSAMALAGCIPMIPGSFFAQAILGLFALTSPQNPHEALQVVITLEYAFRVLFTVGAIGAGLAIPSYLMRQREL